MVPVGHRRLHNTPECTKSTTSGAGSERQLFSAEQDVFRIKLGVLLSEWSPVQYLVGRRLDRTPLFTQQNCGG